MLNQRLFSVDSVKSVTVTVYKMVCVCVCVCVCVRVRVHPRLLSHNKVCIDCYALGNCCAKHLSQLFGRRVGRQFDFKEARCRAWQTVG
jgi:hypothetical protein